MSKVMLYRHPSTITNNDVNKGFCKIRDVSFDWVIVEEKEVESCLKQGFYLTPDEALGAEDEEKDIAEITSKLNELTIEEIKDKYTVKELRKIATSLEIKGNSKMNQDTLVDKIIEIIGE